MIFLLNPFRNRVRKRYMRPGDYQKALTNGLRILIILFLFHVVAMRFLETITAGLQGWSDAIWVTWATFTTVGYGDLSSATITGRFITMVVGTLGIITFAGMAGNWLDYRNYKRELQNTHRWEWRDMKNHILVVGLPKVGTARYLESLIGEIRGRPQFDGHEIQIMAKNIPERDELPAIVKDDKNQVTFFAGSGSEEADLKSCNVKQASYIMVLCPDPTEHDADDVTAAVVYRITEDFGVTVPVVAEVSLDRRTPFIIKNGATSVVRATNDFPGLIITELVAPGSYLITADAFEASGNELNDYKVEVADMLWFEMTCIMAKLGYDFRGYVAANGEVFRFGQTDRVVNASRLFLSIPQGKQPKAKEIQAAIDVT